MLRHNDPLSDVTSMSYACTHVASSETIEMMKVLLIDNLDLKIYLADVSIGCSNVGGANISGGGIAGILFGIAGGLVVLVLVF